MYARPSRTAASALILLLAATALTPAYAADTPATPDPSATPPETDAPGEDILVTARYKNETLQDVPIAITALSAAQIDGVGGQTSLKNLAYFTPSVTIQGFSGRNQTITIRGLGTNSGGTNDGLDQGVGLYIDGVYRPRTGTAITDLMDVETIQLLKGPQGTLFGKNTVAGAIDIRTAEPGFKRQVKAEFSYGNYNYMRAFLSVTNPVSDTLTFRLSYLRTSRQGLIYNTTFSEPWDNLNNDAVRADILWKPSDNFKNRLIADYSMQACDCGFYSVRNTTPTTLANGKPVKGFYEKAADVGYN